MRRMHSQAKENFEVVELPTQEQEEERFQQLQEQLRQRQVRLDLIDHCVTPN